MIAYVHTSLRVLEGWFCVVVLRACVRYSSRCCVVARASSRVGVCPRARAVCPRVRVCARVVACVCVWSRACVCWFGARCCVGVWVCVWGGRACVRGPPSGVLWRFPTLPHPLGCSTIGAAGLSFQVRNVAGRFPGAVTTTRLCRPSPPCWLARCVAGPTAGRRRCCVVGWVGGGLVVVRIVVAASSFFRVRAPRPCPLRAGRCWGAVRFGGLGGLVWCRPISTSRLASASRRFHLWPIDPLFWRGPLTPCGGVETSSRSGLPA